MPRTALLRAPGRKPEYVRLSRVLSSRKRAFLDAFSVLVDALGRERPVRFSTGAATIRWLMTRGARWPQTFEVHSHYGRPYALEKSPPVESICCSSRR